MRTFISAVFLLSSFFSFSQTIDGVFTDFVRSNIWGNTVINSATLETSGYITLSGYYEGGAPTKRIPMFFQISATGAYRTEFANSPVLLSFVNSSSGSSEVDRTYLAATGSNVNALQYIVTGHNESGTGFLTKMFVAGSRPTAFNNGQVTTFSGGGASPKGYFEDWVTGPFVYSVRMNGPSFGNARVLLSSFSRETGAPIANFGENGIVSIPAPEGNMVDASRPIRIIKPATGSNTDKFYVAFSTIGSVGSRTDIAVCRVNINGGTIDSSFGSNGYKSFVTSSRYYITSLLVKTDESITVGGFGDGGMASVPSFYTFRTDESIAITSFNYLLGEPNPGFGCRNLDAKKATINGEERIVFAYAKPYVDGEHYRIAIASLTPGDGVGTDPLVHTPWLGSEYVSAEPTSIITLSGNTGFIVTGKATRKDSTIAGVVLKYTQSGMLDASFGNMGVMIINGFQSGQPWNYAAQMDDNKYLAVGGIGFIPDNLSEGALLLSRFNVDGSPDTSFGQKGHLFAYPSSLGRTGNFILPLPDKKFLVSGTYTNYLNEPGIGTGTAGSKGTVYKFNEDGSPDYSFGPFNNGRFHFAGSIGMSIAGLQKRGNYIYAHGNSSSTNPAGGRGMVLKLTENGINVDIYTSSLNVQQAYTLDESTGDIYAGGNRTGVVPRLICKVKPGNYPQAGLPDPSYGQNGLVQIPTNYAGENLNVREIKVKQGGGLFVVSAWASGTTAPLIYGVLFCSITPGGTVDASFGTNGTKFLQLPGATSIIAHRYKWLGATDDKLMIFGQATVNGADIGFVCRINLDGELDPSFGTGGVTWTTETFLGAIGFTNDGDLLALRNYGFFNGGSIARMDIPAAVYLAVKPGSWTGVIDNDWFKPGNWAEGVVPDAFTEVVISTGSTIIPANTNAFAYTVRVLGGAQLTIGANATLTLTKKNP